MSELTEKFTEIITKRRSWLLLKADKSVLFCHVRSLWKGFHVTITCKPVLDLMTTHEHFAVKWKNVSAISCDCPSCTSNLRDICDKWLLHISIFKPIENHSLVLSELHWIVLHMHCIWRFKVSNDCNWLPIKFRWFCNFTAILNSFTNKACSFVAVVVVVFVMPWLK